MRHMLENSRSKRQTSLILPLMGASFILTLLLLSHGAAPAWADEKGLQISDDAAQSGATEKARPKLFQATSQPPAEQQPTAKTATNTKAEVAKILRVEVEAGQSLEDAWNNYLKEQKPNDASIRRTIRKLHLDQKFDSLTALIRASMLNGRAQPWMYEVLGIAMQIQGADIKDRERALMSAVEFAGSPEDIMTIADYMSRAGGLDARALSLYREISRKHPLRPEPYVLGLRIAQRQNDVAGIQWATLGILSQAWSKDQAEIESNAYLLAMGLVADLRKQGKVKEAIAFEKAIQESRKRDFQVKVSWNGDADVDLLVEEPPGTICSSRNPRSTSGGVLIGENRSSQGAGRGNSYEQYVCPQGFSGTYRILVRRVWGKLVGGKVTVAVYLHQGSQKEKFFSKIIRLGDQDAVTAVDLNDGRRVDSLDEKQIATASQEQVAVGRAVLAQQLSSLVDPQVAAQLESSRSSTPTFDPRDPFVRRGRGGVGFQPQIITLPEGTNMSATAVISADRRYVRITAIPVFSSIGDVTTFTFDSGDDTTSDDDAADDDAADDDAADDDAADDDAADDDAAN